MAQDKGSFLIEIKNLRFKIKPELPNKKEKIKLGYFSADFRENATTYLMARLFELHDKNRFELILFSFCPIRPNDEEQKRVIKSADKFIDVSNKNNFEICEEVKNLGIDIAIDLKGHTLNSKTKLFAYRMAPIQINYLGYPGSLGTSFIDYIKSLDLPLEIKFYHNDDYKNTNCVKF